MRIVADAKHKVTDGDTLLGLAWLYYGHPGGVAWIWLENIDIIGHDPDNLPVGSIVIIPVIETVEVRMSGWSTLTDSPRGDARVDAAKRHYGSGWMWQVFRMLQVNGGINSRPPADHQATVPARGKGYPLDEARRWAREIGR